MCGEKGGEDNDANGEELQFWHGACGIYIDFIECRAVAEV